MKPSRDYRQSYCKLQIYALGLSSILGGVVADWWDARFPTADSAPLGFQNWQFAFVVAASPGGLLAILLWRIREPERGRMDGIHTPPDPAPFGASAKVLNAVLPVSNWMLLRQHRAGIGALGANLAGLGVIVLAMTALIYWCRAVSPRPPVLLGELAVDPHVLQWCVVGFGLFVIFNLIQSMRYSDPGAYAVMAGSPSLILCRLTGSLQSMINYGVMGFTPAFLMKTYGLSLSATGLQFGVLTALLGVLGPLIAGLLSDRLNKALPGAGRIWVTMFALGVSPIIALSVNRSPGPSDFYLRFTLYSLVLSMWLPPLYAVMFDQVLPRLRAITMSIYIFMMTILGLGVGPYLVEMISDANGGDLAGAILTINWVAPVIMIFLIILAMRAHGDEERMLERARLAGEAV